MSRSGKQFRKWLRQFPSHKRQSIVNHLRNKARIPVVFPHSKIPERKSKLLRVETDHFVAGAVFVKDGTWFCTHAAPIIHWMKNRSTGQIHTDLLRLGAKWTWHEIKGG